MHRIRTDFADEHHVRIERLHLREIWAEIGRAVRRPKLLDNLPAVLRERLTEATGIFESERVRTTDRHGFAMTLFVRPHAGRMRRQTRAPARNLHDVRAGSALRKIVG